MLVYEIFFFTLQRQCLTEFPSPMVLCIKRFIVDDHGYAAIMIENNTMWASGTRLELVQG
jgi:hypothetical protein